MKTPQIPAPWSQHGQPPTKKIKKYVREFILGQGYVTQPPTIITEEEMNAEIEKQGGQKYQNVWYEPVEE